MSLPSVSVIVPVHDGEATLRELVARLRAVLARCASRSEVILVNDGSSDGSWATIQTLCAEQRNVRGIDLARNVGQHSALLCGVRAAREEWIVTLDDDLQHPPEEIPRLLAAAEGGADVVYGTAVNPDDGWLRRAAARGARRMLAREIGTVAARQASAFRCFRARLRENFADHRGRAVLLDVLLARKSPRFASVPVQLAPRRQGRSGYGLRQLVALALSIRRTNRGPAVNGVAPYDVRSSINVGP